VLHAAAGKSTAQIGNAVGYDPSAVLKVLHRFAAEGVDDQQKARNSATGQWLVSSQSQEVSCSRSVRKPLRPDIARQAT
jgi:hypothetical protein